jgi:hypothetical protein
MTTRHRGVGLLWICYSLAPGILGISAGLTLFIWIHSPSDSAWPAEIAALVSLSVILSAWLAMPKYRPKTGALLIIVSMWSALILGASLVRSWFDDSATSSELSVLALCIVVFFTGVWLRRSKLGRNWFVA